MLISEMEDFKQYLQAPTNLCRTQALKWLLPAALPFRVSSIYLLPLQELLLRDEQVGLTQAFSNFCIHTESGVGEVYYT